MSRDAVLVNATGGDGEGRDAELGRMLDAFLADIEAGRPADPDRLLAEHPSLADRLRALLPLLALPDAFRYPTSGGSGGVETTDAASGWVANGAHPSVLLPDAPSLGNEPILTRTPDDVGTLGRYRILGELARGGMGSVLKAHDEELGRDLVVKILRGRYRHDPAALRRFVEEAQIGGQLQHPGIVPVYELGVSDSHRPFIAMKLVNGVTLAALLTARPEPTRERERFLGIFRSVCQTVAYAHARQVIHRDLKPTNVMVGSFGEVQVMDWGLAKVLSLGGFADEPRPAGLEEAEALIRTIRSEERGSDSEAGSVLGTPAYMAPEQARGEVARLDERADVFGLGAMLCEILTGRPPFEGRNPVEVRARAADAELAGAQRRLDSCGADPELITLARDCLAADPADRPRDGGAVEKRLASYFESMQTRLRSAEIARVEAEARAEAERLRRRLTVALSVTLLATATLVGGGLWSRSRLATARVEASHQKAEARNQRLNALRFRYVADIRRAARLVQDHRVKLATDSLAGAVPKPGEPDLRDFAWGYLLQRCHTERATLLRHKGEVYHAEFAPGGRTLATCGQDRSVCLWDAASGRAIRTIVGHDWEVNWVTFSPDGTTLATASDDGQVRLWSVANGQPLAVLHAHEGAAVALLFTPDGRRLVSCGRDDGRVKLWDRETRQLIRAFVAHEGLVENMSLSPDGSMLATVCQSEQGKLWHLDDGRLLATLEGHKDMIHGVAFAPDGRTLATAARDHIVRVFGVPSGRLLRELVGHPQPVYSVEFSADGRTILSAGDDHTLHLWDAATGKLLGVHQGHTDRIWDIATAPDGTIASVSRDGTAKLWSVAGPRDRDIVPVAGAMALRFSPDGQELTVVEDKGALSFWDVATLEPTRRIRLELPVSSPAWGVKSAVLAGHPPVLAIADWSERVSLWDAATGGFRTMLPSPVREVTELTLSRDGSRLLIREPDSISLWDTRSVRRLAIAPAAGGPISLALDGRVAIYARGEATRVFWEPDSDRSRTSDNPFFNGMLCLTSSPDGLRLASGDWHSRVVVWNMNELRPDRVLLGHSDVVRSITFSPDGDLLASGGEGLRLWDASTGEELLGIGPLGGDRILELVFAPDGNCLAVRTQDLKEGYEVSLHRAARLPSASRSTGGSSNAQVDLSWLP